jgi:hypothetical protein
VATLPVGQTFGVVIMLGDTGAVADGVGVTIGAALEGASTEAGFTPGTVNTAEVIT